MARAIDGWAIWLIAPLLIFGFSFALELYGPDLAQRYYDLNEDRFGRFVANTPLILLAWVVYEVLALTLFGTTFGKLTMGVKIADEGGRRPGLKAVLGRSILVQVIGFACRIPLLNIAAMFFAYTRARNGRPMLWDEYSGTVVTRLVVPTWRWWLAGALWAASASSNMIFRYLN